MKKIMYVLCMAAVSGLCMASCSEGDADQAKDKEEAAKAQAAANDSMSIAYGRMVGTYLNSELGSYAKYEGKAYDKKEFEEGLRAVLGAEHSEAYLAGMASGFRVSQDIKELGKIDITINRADVLGQIGIALQKDTVTTQEINDNQNAYSRLIQSAQERHRLKQETEASTDPEVVKNVKTAEAYMNKQQQENANIQKSASGLYYVIDKKGAGKIPGDNDIVTVKYVGRHIDGTVFDQNDHAQFAPSQVVKGFGEGLKMLAPGGKATLYIPGKLGYGVHGQPQAGIRPMEMLVFDVEVLDVTPAAAPAAK